MKMYKKPTWNIGGVTAYKLFYVGCSRARKKEPCYCRWWNQNQQIWEWIQGEIDFHRFRDSRLSNARNPNSLKRFHEQKNATLDFYLRWRFLCIRAKPWRRSRRWKSRRSSNTRLVGHRGFWTQACAGSKSFFFSVGARYGVKARALFAGVSSCRSASNNKGEAVDFSFVVCE